ncbi:MAG: glycosyltransferase family 2 protein [Chloroflexi bacterium]|nr:glycosyltransferase family 2 protein [Chloroflexota bacterium]
MPVSVIVIARNAEKNIGDCLASVQANLPAEIIVIDGNSTDRTLTLARQYSAEVLSDGGRGKAYARQLGAEMARQEYIAYVDSDVALEEGALATMLKEFQGSGHAAIRAQVRPGMKCSSYWQWAQYQHHLWSSRREHIGMMACLMRRETILNYGFDPDAGDIDDTVIELKLINAGFTFGVSSALVRHSWPPGLSQLVRYRFFLGRLKPLAIQRYGPWHPGFWPPVSALYWVVISLVKGKPALIPYLLVDGIAKTAGMVAGSLDMLCESLRKKKPA